MSSILTGLTTLFTPVAAGTAAAGTAAAAATVGAGQSFLGQLLSGMATGLMAGMKSKEEEEQQIRLEKRQEGRYKGLGDSAAYWENAQSEGNQIEPEEARVGRDPDNYSRRFKGLGEIQAEVNTPMPGERSTSGLGADAAPKTFAPPKKEFSIQNKRRRFRFNTETGLIEQ